MTEAIARYCASQPTLSTAVQNEVQNHLLDWIGLVTGGRIYARSSKSVLQTIDALTESDLPRGIPIGRSIAPDKAALLAGTLAHSLDFDDTHRSSSVHPGAPVIAAALPVAATNESDSTEFLEAISLGYDVTCALGRAVDPDSHYARGFHLTATCGTFGATAAVGHLNGFDAETFEMAFGINGSQAAGSLQFLENGAWNKRLHPGLAAQRAIYAGELAASSFLGSESPITGEFGFFHGYTDTPHPEKLENIEPGRAVQETALKPYPCCRYMHAGIDGLLSIAREVDIDEIQQIEIDLPNPGVRLTGSPIERKRRPENFVDCQFSAPFAAALAVTTGEASLHAFLDAQDRLSDPVLCEMMDRVIVRSTDRTNEPFPDQWTAHVIVEADERHERFISHPPGEPERPLDPETIEAKFDELITESPLRNRADAITETVSALGSRTELGELLALLE